MTMIGANVAIIVDGQVLLAKREDFEVWCLPGGMIEPGESLAQAAIREAREETGLEVELTRMVGVYSRVGGYTDIHGTLFAAIPVGGMLQPQIEEVLDLRYFDADKLPHDMFWWHRSQVHDACNGVGCGIARRTHLPDPQHPVNSRQELYTLRDLSGMSRTAFYHHFFEQGELRDVIEVQASTADDDYSGQ
jgi:ADP-ribose pyrophosphatase YjhB (NUDIX family)